MRKNTMLWLAALGIGVALYLKNKSESTIPDPPPIKPHDTPVSNDEPATM